VLNRHGGVVFRFPDAADLTAGRKLYYNDDTFVEPGGRALIANEEDNHAIVEIGIADHVDVLQRSARGEVDFVVGAGHDVAGSGHGRLHHPVFSGHDPRRDARGAGRNAQLGDGQHGNAGRHHG
jgi:hypothetical protein